MTITNMETTVVRKKPERRAMKAQRQPVVEVVRDATEWDALVEGARHGTVFHSFGFLEAMAASSGMKLVPMVARRGDDAVGLFPVFVQTVGFLRLGFSPPPGTLVPRLGPLLLGDHSHQADRERHGVELAAVFNDFITKRLRIGAMEFGAVSETFDPRPYLWLGYSARPVFTYSLSMKDGAEAAFNGFKKQIRTDARRAANYTNLRLEEGGVEVYNEVINLTRKRYREQGEVWAPSDEYLADVFKKVNAGGKRIRCWGVYEENVLISGVIVLFHNGMALHWIGGVRYEAPYIGVNEWLHRTVIQAAEAEGFHTYEMVGANTERLCRHKSKYNPRADVAYVMTRRTGLGGAAARLLDVKTFRRFLKSWKKR